MFATYQYHMLDNSSHTMSILCHFSFNNTAFPVHMGKYSQIPHTS